MTGTCERCGEFGRVAVCDLCDREICPACAGVFDTDRAVQCKDSCYTEDKPLAWNEP